MGMLMVAMTESQLVAMKAEEMAALVVVERENESGI
eukprot:CAMPEP_0170127462 /NCGR_PEP_ID=MMETSP0020_2-20130122/20449_1 /TAXON_ID=98059 /ORGANISM="Dinobryon sp., Strain UTEXLB2267" /LENGTH=35 /DNA_ID= /DNA_START= /DNA_END= /DNA_ORIENTATION=